MGVQSILRRRPIIPHHPPAQRGEPHASPPTYRAVPAFSGLADVCCHSDNFWRHSKLTTLCQRTDEDRKSEQHPVRKNHSESEDQCWIRVEADEPRFRVQSLTQITLSPYYPLVQNIRAWRRKAMKTPIAKAISRVHSTIHKNPYGHPPDNAGDRDQVSNLK